MSAVGDPVAEFLEAMGRLGLAPKQPIRANGRLHRFYIEGDAEGSSNGFYVLHLDGRPAGAFGCWRRGIKETWKASGAPFSTVEQAELMRKIEADERRRKREEAKRHKDVAESATRLWSGYEPAPADHPYLSRKRIQPHGAMSDSQGRLALPMSDVNGTIWSVQTIDAEGGKLFMAGGRKRGCMFVLGEPSDRTVIAEGFATAASIHEATGLCVAVAFDGGNLEPVAQAIRTRWPSTQIVIAADDDCETKVPIDNPGLHYARKATAAVGARVAIPTREEPNGKALDFNDLATLEGGEAVARIILAEFPAAPPSAATEDDRQLIRVELGELPAAVAASNRRLAERSTTMYVLGDLLVTLEDAGAGLQTVPTTQTRIGLELARVARFEKVARVTDDGPEWRKCDPPMKLAAAIADEPGGWRSPSLAGLTEVPILRPNGRVVTTPGYDRASRLFLCGGPFAPMLNDPHAALAVLVDALGEFPFVLPHHQSAALALMLTAVIRRQLPAAPMFGISAREAGTGKGALASLAAIMATGRRAPETPWPATADEQRKVITATLIAGQPILILDNIVGVLDGAPLCVLITAETWSDRLLGASRLVQLPASALVVATGNNLTVAGDLCRRVVPIEMDAGCESPELREFERELVPWAIENRPGLVGAALTILAAHRKAGSPLPADFKPLGSFEEWSRTVCGALVWMGKRDPRDAMAEIRANDPKRLLLTRVLAGMEALFGRQWQSAGVIFDAAKASKEREPGLIEAIEEITAKARDEKAAKIALGRWFSAEKGRVVGGLRLEGERDEHAKVNTWRADQCG